LLKISILSGCDYLSNIKGVGLKSAFKLYFENFGDTSAVVHQLMPSKAQER
jgi:5'-3' exonuclease